MPNQANYAVIPPLRDDQKRIALAAHRYRVVACGRRWGKTTLALALAFQYAQRGDRVWWVAPTYGLAFHPWRTLRAAFVTHPELKERVETKLESEKYLELEGGGSLHIKTAHDPDLLRGVGLDFVVLDEAAYLDRRVWEAVLYPALADRQGRALIISTPHGRNWFWEVYRRGLDDLFPAWGAWRAPTADNPLISPQTITDARLTLPSVRFKQEYEAEFLKDGGEVFRGVRSAATASPGAGPQAGHSYVMGVDFGRHVDFTAVVVIDATARRMVALDRFSEVNWRVQRSRIAHLAARWQVSGVLAERNAMGEPNIEALRGEGVPIEGFTTTAASKPGLIDALVVALENGELALLTDEVLLGELESYTAERQASGHVRYSAPPGQHDDTVIALALAWRLANTPRMSLGTAAV